MADERHSRTYRSNYRSLWRYRLGPSYRFYTSQMRSTYYLLTYTRYNNNTHAKVTQVLLLQSYLDLSLFSYFVVLVSVDLANNSQWWSCHLSLLTEFSWNCNMFFLFSVSDYLTYLTIQIYKWCHKRGGGLKLKTMSWECSMYEHLKYFMESLRTFSYMVPGEILHSYRRF